MKSSRWLMVALTVALLAGGSIIAAAAPKKAAKAAAGSERPARGKSFAQAKEELALTDEQVTQIRAVFKGEKENLTGLLSRLREARGTLREAIRSSGASEVSVRTASAKVADVEADLAVERLKLYGKISPILTPEQHEKLRQFEAQANDFLEGLINRLNNRQGE